MVKPENEITVTAAEVSDYCRITGLVVPALREVVERKVTVTAARKAGIEVSMGELQKAADYFRFARGFNKARDTGDWLESNAISIEALEEHLETNLLISKFRDYLVEEASRSKTLALPGGAESSDDRIYQDWLAEQFQ